MPARKERRELTQIERRHAELLRAAWKRAKKDQRRDVKARALAKELGVDESLISQYMNGIIPLNVEWKMRFAQYLDCVPQSIWPDWEFKSLTPGQLPPKAVRVALDWNSLDPRDQPAIDVVIDRLRQKKAS